MKAIVFSQHGGPEVLRYTEVPEPKISANEVLVRVRACALNHLDLWVRRGLPGIRFQFPHIPGSDIAGEVAEVETLFGYLADGGCAEYVKSPAANIIPIPTSMKFEEAAAIPVVFLTAWHMLIT